LLKLEINKFNILFFLEDMKMKKFSMLFMLVLAVSLSGPAQADWNATNLLLNGGFETPDANSVYWTAQQRPEPNSWQFETGVAGAIVGYNSNMATLNYITPTSPPDDVNYFDPPAGAHGGSCFIGMVANLANSWALCYQSHPCAEKRQYRLEAYVYAPDIGGVVTPQLKIDYRDSGGNLMNASTKDVNFPGTTKGAWTLLALNSNISPVGARTVSGVVGTSVMAGAMDYTELYWDDVTLTMITPTAPTSCELLQFKTGWDFAVGDLNRDCVIDFKDYAIFAQYWLQCNAHDYVPACNYTNGKKVQ
jgi:hypothetical protein